MKWIPKKYMDNIAEVYKDSDGWWAYTKDGFMFDGMGCHTAHENTQKELLEMIRTMVPCDCSECKEEEVVEGTEEVVVEKEVQESKPVRTIHGKIGVATFIEHVNGNDKYEVVFPSGDKYNYFDFELDFQEVRHIEKGDFIKIKVRGSKYSGKVISANYFGSDGGWYIEFVNETLNRYSYWKQGGDGGEIIEHVKGGE